jgi:hypothetical protein
MTERSEYSKQEDALAWLETEQKRAGKLRIIGYAAWVVTFVVLALYAVIVGYNVMVGYKAMAFVGQAGHGGLNFLGLSVLVKAITPLLVVVGVTAMLVAVLSTIGIFVRTRTASLAEIQLRLAALERALTREED